MNYQIIDLLDKLISKDTDNDLKLLIKEGVLSTEGQLGLNKLNLMTGAVAADLLDSITEAEVNVQEVLNYIEGLQKQNEDMSIYYFLFSMLAAFEMDVPYLFLQLPSHAEALKVYLRELLADLKDYSLDLGQAE
jgi:hypothetical protein